MKSSQISKAISIALTGSALAFGGISTASAHTMYNMFGVNTAPGNGATDGWVYGFSTAPSGAATPGWVGTQGNVLGTVGTTNIFDGTPFGYTGGSALNWAGMLHGAGASIEISSADAAANYDGLAADIDTAGGAWLDVDPVNPQGWKHNTDIGILQTNVNQQVHLNISAVNGPIANFGVTIFEGMDTSTGTYGHHGPWNNPTATDFLGNPIGLEFDAENPFGTTGLTHLKYDSTVDSTAGGTITFDAIAGQIYTIYLGGSGGTNWNQQHDRYVLNVSTSPSAVPVPAAAWLLGSGLIGLFSYGRRKNTAV